jgi:hypothetical protein
MPGCKLKTAGFVEYLVLGAINTKSGRNVCDDWHSGPHIVNGDGLLRHDERCTDEEARWEVR